MTQREIKFRVWDIYSECFCSDPEDGEYIYNIHPKNGIIVLAETEIAKEGGGEAYLKISFEKIDCIIEQYTGLKDKNGVEIYEGDINQDKGVCTWNNKLASFEWIYPSGDVYGFEIENEWCKVIGNIHQNSDLLK